MNPVSAFGLMNKNMRLRQLLPVQHFPTLTCLSNDRMIVVTVVAEMLDILTKVDAAGEL